MLAFARTCEREFRWQLRQSSLRYNHGVVPDSEPTARSNTYTSRLQKGGALLDSMRALTLVWGEKEAGADRLADNAIGLPSRRRVRDVIQRTFIPRLVESRPPHLWRVAAVLEKASADRSIIVPLHYYATAVSEPLLWDFVLEELYPRAGTGREVSTDDALRFIDSRPDELFVGRHWTPTVATKVARGLLAALRDYGILTGASKKRLGSPYLPVESFALIGRIRYELGYRGEAAIRDDVWKLFFLERTGVERFLAEATAEHLVRYESAGPVVRIEFREMSLEEYAGYTARRAVETARV